MTSTLRRISNSDAELLRAATVAVGAGVLLTMLPMKSVYTDWTWFGTCILCVAPYLAVVIAFRWRGQSEWWAPMLGLLASVLMLTWVFVPDHLLLGVLPTRASIDDIGLLLNSAHDTMQNDHAPVASTDGLRLITAAAAVGLVALADVLAVGWRKPLLAAAPLLEVLVVASATSGRAASPVLFIAAAVGFLLILLVGTRLQDHDWGPSVDGSAGRLGGARRIAITGIVAALVVPLAFPAISANLLARASHHGAGDGFIGSGSAQVELNTTADLSGSLKRGTPVNLFQVQVRPSDKPYYVRQVVLDQFNNSGWVESSTSGSAQRPVGAGEFPIAPASVDGGTDTGGTTLIQASFTIEQLGGQNLPLLANPEELSGDIRSRAAWDETTATVDNVRLNRGQTYHEVIAQPSPSEQDLESAPTWTGSGNAPVDARYLSLPSMPSEVSDLAARLTAGISSPYLKARAITQYFLDPGNGFTYSLNTAPVDNRGALVSFLENKKGFCQQYAGAAAVLMRLAGLPTRVVLGYTHQPPAADGTFTVTSADAHAWVEVYFSGVGWVPFDPTPLQGSDLSRAIALPWVQASTSTGPSSAGSGSTQSNGLNKPLGTTNPNDVAGATNGAAASRGGVQWTGIGWAAVAAAALLAILGGPQLIRRQQRRRRFATSKVTGDPEPLWRELSATATDRGMLWPGTITVGQVPDWLSEHGVDHRGSEAVSAVAVQVERARYSDRGAGTVPDEVITGLDEAMRRWARRASRREQLRAWWWPKSLLSRWTADRR
jgi:hypothetical protein